MRSFLGSRLFWWPLLALPAMGMVYGFASGASDAMDQLNPTGEFSVRLMVIAMLIGPLVDILGPRRWLRWIIARRRWLGFAAFGYALLHLVFYLIDMGTIDDVLAEIAEHGIWTGWLAFALMLLPALTSTDAAMRALRRSWKQMQRFAYPAALFTALHWGLLEMHWVPALIHFGPLLAVNLIRIIKRRQRLAQGVPA